MQSYTQSLFLLTIVFQLRMRAYNIYTPYTSFFTALLFIIYIQVAFSIYLHVSFSFIDAFHVVLFRSILGRLGNHFAHTFRRRLHKTLNTTIAYQKFSIVFFIILILLSAVMKASYSLTLSTFTEAVSLPLVLMAFTRVCFSFHFGVIINFTKPSPYIKYILFIHQPQLCFLRVSREAVIIREEYGVKFYGFNDCNGSQLKK